MKTIFRPILFSTPMVQAILDGRKTTTRRVLKKQPLDILLMNVPNQWVTLDVREPEPHGKVVKCRFGQVGDHLWVRETFLKSLHNEGHERPAVSYLADYEELLNGHWKKYPSIFMPRWASRITLEITDVKVERLHDITEEDAAKEGYPNISPVEKITAINPVGWFSSLWDYINGKTYPWSSNPWVWVIEFKRVT